MTQKKLKNIIEAILLSADRPLDIKQMEAVFENDKEMPSRDELRKALLDLEKDYESRGFELKKVASGYRIQVKQDFSSWVSRLWDEKPARYTRALLETMALIAYRQPVTRGEIEEVRGVSVSSNTIRTMMERNWIRVLGHKDVPGKPALYGTTKEFLDYFNLKSLDDLPTLAEIKDFDKLYPELALEEDVSEEEPKATVEDNADSSYVNELQDESQELEEVDSAASATGV